MATEHPLDIDQGRCNCTALRRASRRLTATYDRMLAPHKIRSTQFSILFYLDREKKVRINDLAELLIMDGTTVTRNLKPLERDGYLSIEKGKDRRERWVGLTAEGKALLTEALPAWQEAQRNFEDSIGHEDAGDLRGMLNQVAALTG
ncbi:MarR family winged helix-turn-helix transcriptional regulator [Ruegeria jejuensis]|uniref:MarR family winged helix-turn-helix transcriptional regulator n=1 Tax=Ruegeria jejuensis TaxID=3233338 RepID=UPI00355C58CF